MSSFSGAVYRAAIFRAVKEHVLALDESSHIHPLLIIEEAHLLNTNILKELRLITNFHIDSVNALTVLRIPDRSYETISRLPISDGVKVLADTSREEPGSRVRRREPDPFRE